MERQRGFTLVELLIALVVVLSILFVVASGARVGFDDANGKRLGTALIILDDRVRDAYAQRFDYATLSTTTAWNEGLIPLEWSQNNGTTITPYPATNLALGAVAGSYNYSRYRMTLTGFVAPAPCSHALRLITPGMMRVEVTPKGGGSGVVLSTGRGTVPSAGLIAAACALQAQIKLPSGRRAPDSKSLTLTC